MKPLSYSRYSLCDVFNSPPGRITLNYKPPTKNALYNTDNYRLVTCWDILKQDYRNISIEYNDIIAAMPVRTVDEIKVFWQYFEAVLKEMNATDKIKFMNL